MNDASLRFRKLSLCDIAIRTNILNEKETIAGITIESPVSPTASEQWFDRAQRDTSRRDFVLDRSGTPVGFSGIVNINYKDKNGEIYIFVARSCQNQGLGSTLLQLTIGFARAELNLRKISLYVTASNLQAIKFYERNGF